MKERSNQPLGSINHHIKSVSFLATCYETENKHATSIIGKQ